MPLQSNGPISLSDIYIEVNGQFPGSNDNVSLTTLSQNYNNDPCNTASVNGVAPHGLEEFYNYDHNCGGSACHVIDLAGPYGDFGEACEMGSRDPSNPYNSDSTSATVGTFIFNDPSCTTMFPGGNLWYYDVAGSQALQIQDDGMVAGTATCSSKSDRRLKENITQIGTSPSGIPIYTFEFIDDDKYVYEGTMAQDLLEMGLNDLVITGEDGYYHVLYHLTDVKMVKRPK